MAERGLGLKYLSWLHEQCCLKENIRSLKSYYFSIFFLDGITEEYKASILPEPEPPPELPLICPACGLERRKRKGECPSCGLPENPAPETIMLYRALHEFPPEKRGEYLRREEALYNDYGAKFTERDKFQTLLAGLKQEFGLTASP
jgi:hypothetical protein